MYFLYECPKSLAKMASELTMEDGIYGMHKCLKVQDCPFEHLW